MAQVAGNLQRIRNGQRRYAITPRIPAGFIQPQTLQKFIDVANTFHATLKITGAQRIMITNLKAEDVDKAWEMLGMQPAHSVSNRVRSVKICPGTTFCKRAKQDSVHLGMQLEQKYISKEMPSKMKFGISGCPNSCAESITKDIGIIGTEQGWQVYAGGSAGAHPRFADLIAEVTTEQEVLDLVDRMVAYYKENAHIERMGAFIDRIGLATFKEAVLGDDYVPSTEDTAAAPAEPVVNLPGMANEKGAMPLEAGEPITADSIVRDIIEAYPETIPALQAIGMGCLGCPSSTAEPLWQAADIHGFDVNELVERLETIRKGA
ncbi:DUF1858 domain-containing protein [Veillonella magna]|uniref:DUF1858 domain-containing protein n=1 Tax=Veillonella magna TaxID=464322 RepID=A0ABS2GHQ2_9FIRM|nr:DUF1858 domain-containing protein [Veillonella magna]MBM6824400.1 DUF1858 domain-containing protein [Veillonella magna]MBM6912694.1 DUF1858 domain-containing protein [Veillonella magna]